MLPTLARLYRRLKVTMIVHSLLAAGTLPFLCLAEVVFDHIKLRTSVIAKAALIFALKVLVFSCLNNEQSEMEQPDEGGSRYCRNLQAPNNVKRRVAFL